MKKKNIIFFIIGIICPIIGVILYFILKNKDKNKSNSFIKGSIVGFCIYSIFILYISTHSTDYFNRSTDEWYNDVKSGNTVLTVIGASYCSHCQEYKPVIKTLADKNKINLYFYEIDTLSSEDQEKLTNSFDIGDYKGSVPYTFIMKDGSFVSQNTGYSNESAITSYLWENELIKD